MSQDLRATAARLLKEYRSRPDVDWSDPVYECLDELLTTLDAAERRERTAFEAIGKFLEVWPDVEKRVNGMIGLQFARTGVGYDGPQLPIKELRDAYTAYQAHAQTRSR